MDELDKIIQDAIKRRDHLKGATVGLEYKLHEVEERLANTKAELRDVEVELAALKRAAEIRPINVDIPFAPEKAEPPAVKRGGRQPGSLSMKWRLALADIVAAGNNWVDHQQFYLLTRGRLRLNESSVRERVRSYLAQGILEEQDNKLRVAAWIIAKYNLAELGNDDETASPAEASEAANGSGVQPPDDGGSRPLTPPDPRAN